MSRVRIETVGRDEDGMRLDRWFRSRFPELTQGRLQKLLRTGQVRVEGGRVKADTRVVAGQSVRVPPLGEAPAPSLPVTPRPVSDRDARALQDRVLYRDDEVLAIDKPAGLAVQGGSGVSRHLDGMLPALQFDAAEPPRLVHRLDRDTSGVLLLARTRQAATWLTRAFRDRSTEKTYWAIVIGTPRPSEGDIRLNLLKEGGHGAERVVAVPEGGQKAVTQFTTIAHAGKRAAWLAMRPLTGRTHQLRVHAVAMGHPIVGDGKYGGADAHPGGFARHLHLHARHLVLTRPDGRRLDVTAPAPTHFLAALDLLGFDPNDRAARVTWPD